MTIGEVLEQALEPAREPAGDVALR
jgi:hypothetical protein